MKRILVFCLLVLVLLSQTGCWAMLSSIAEEESVKDVEIKSESSKVVDNESKTSSETEKSEQSEQSVSEAPASSEEEAAEALSAAEIKEMYTDAKKFIGRPVELVGQIFDAPEYDGDAVYFQMFTDVKNWNQNTIVAYENSDIELDDGDYVRVNGVVHDVFKGENAFGGEITAPAIMADSIEILTYKDALSPTLHEMAPEEKTQTQHGYSVTVEKVELAETETRVYIKVENNGSSNFNLYSFNSKLIQDGKQYEVAYNYEADYPEVQTDLIVGVTTEGVFCFPAIEHADFQLILEGSSDDWEEEIELFVFDVVK